MLTGFDQIFEELRGRGSRKRMVAAWGVDGHTVAAAGKAVEAGIVDVTLVGDEAMIAKACNEEGIDIASFTIVQNPDEMSSVAQAVQMVREGQGDFLMKGLCSTDKFLRAILNKETGLLPPKGTLSHCTVLEIPQYHKLLFVGDVAVIPAPDFKQKQVILDYIVRTAKAVGVDKPKVAVIAATEQVLPSQPATIEAAMLAKMADRGQIKGCIVDGPLALDVAIDKESVEIKGLVSPVAGDADCLLFPNIESGNVFYKSNSKLVPGVRQAGILVGAKVPCVLSSRADSIDTKLNSIAIAAMSAR
ncbi:MAG: bifunctional enoyl-CoA hydratase/phosphate acetyltransferase [Bacteroidales bacterium]|jgi:phosphate butyryltransferase|nr:bifunctional enoyl-CoA hydratase/phosphate acetyltransferase [Bacteroidales bacterium]MBQ5603270.1 bifunctional enoyl-CoA hydratase/phosphate acetyltransferase [Bacteroidales bacterium]